MKSLTHSFLLALALALTMGACVSVHAQMFEQSLAAAQRGDYSTAFAGFKNLAEQGDATAQFNLGLMYALGHGMAKDEQQAVAWFSKAAVQGEATAQSSLGTMYAHGLGVPKDEQQAVAWLRKAAEQGIARAQYNLGFMYYNGNGVPRDEQSAYSWWLMAGAQGYQDAVKANAVMERRLSPAQRAAAQAFARNWQPKSAAQSSNVIGGSTAYSSGSNPAPSRPSSAPSLGFDTQCHKAQVCDDFGQSCQVRQICGSSLDLPSISLPPARPLPTIDLKPLPSITLPPLGTTMCEYKQIDGRWQNICR